MATNESRVPVVVPDFSRNAKEPIEVSHWVKTVGQRVIEGMRVVDLVCDKAEFEVVAHATGVLVEPVKHVGEQVTVGEHIGWIDRVVEAWVADPVPAQATATGRCPHCSALVFPGDLRCRNCGALN